MTLELPLNVLHQQRVMSAFLRLRLPRNKSALPVMGSGTGKSSGRYAEGSSAPLPLREEANVGASPSAQPQGFWEDHNSAPGWSPFTASGPASGSPGFDREMKCHELRCSESQEVKFAKEKVRIGI